MGTDTLSTSFQSLIDQSAASMTSGIQYQQAMSDQNMKFQAESSLIQMKDGIAKAISSLAQTISRNISG